MSGIRGFPDTPIGAREVVDAQLRLLGYCGPDSSNRFTSPPGRLAQARPAVIDLDTGNPPMINEDATSGAVLVGDIYNHRILRPGLETTLEVFLRRKGW